MDYSVQEIKDWLKRIGKNRKWLAEKCFVAKSTVDCWLAPTRDIPPAKVAYIKKLKEESWSIGSSSPINYDAVITFPVRLTPEEWEMLLPPNIDPKDHAAAEKYVRDLLQSVVDSTPPMPRPEDDE